MIRRAAVISSLLIAVSRVAAAQVPFIPGDAEASAQLAKIVESTRQSGLPVEPILAKVQYALLVAHAPSSRIVSVAREVDGMLVL